MDAKSFFQQLWSRYIAMTPQARLVHEHIERKFGTVINDHVAFRTFDLPGMSLFDLEHAFLELGYQREKRYEFPEKHLEAYGYLPPDDQLPLVFLSHLSIRALSNEAAQAISSLVRDDAQSTISPAQRFLLGAPWKPPSSDVYRLLAKESPYAAWLSVWGLCANHFTVAVHRLPGSPTLRAVVDSLGKAGFSLNDHGGVIKGNREALLEQASTMAEERPVHLLDARRLVPSCYYEFALRHRDETGEIYQGFVASSASHLFESTTAEPQQAARS